MANLFNNNYSTIITSGLGAPACCALITSGFGLNCGCTVEIIVPPPIVGGGGGTVSGFYVPLPQKTQKCDRIVLVTVKFSEQTVWRRQYVVDVCNADKMVKVINFVNSAKTRLVVGVEHIKQFAGNVVAIFNKDK